MIHTLLGYIFFATTLFGCVHPEKDTSHKQDTTSLSIVPIEAIHNPERGYHLAANYYVHNLERPFRPYLTYPLGWFADFNERYKSQSGKLSSLQLYLYLTEYVGQPIPPDAFENMQLLFESAKEHGYKFVLRFAYDNTYGATDATFDDVFRHLDQLEPFIKKNIGLIDIWQIGFIGAWGEGHSSPMTNDYEGRTKLAQRILDIFEDRQTTVRLPSHKNRLQNMKEYKQRMGYNNDYFTASEHPKAAGNDFVIGTKAYKQVQQESPYVKVIGEIPYAEQTEWGLHTIISVPNTLKTLRDHHYSLFDITQNNELNIAHWKTYPVSAEMLAELEILFDESYFIENAQPCSRSAYEFIRDHLGYRLYVDMESTRLAVSGDQLQYTISFRNVGFSAIHNPRSAYLVLIDENGEINQKAELDVDPKTWQPYDPDLNDYQVLTHTIKGTMPVAMKGKYKVGLWLPDATEPLTYNGRYAIQFANKGMEIWEDVEKRYRVNIVGELNF